MKRLTWGLVIAFPVVAIVLFVLPAPQPWQAFLALPAIGVAVQFVAVHRRLRFVGLVMTVVGVWTVVVAVQDDARGHQRVLRAVWEKEMHLAEQRATPLPSAPQRGPLEGAR